MVLKKSLRLIEKYVFFSPILLILLGGCSTLSKHEDFEVQNLESGSVQDLARSSYLKGCVDATTESGSKPTRGKMFSKCLDRAKNHEKTIKAILYGIPSRK